jgi:hypothetical protein
MGIDIQTAISHPTPILGVITVVLYHLLRVRGLGPWVHGRITSKKTKTTKKTKKPRGERRALLNPRWIQCVRVSNIVLLPKHPK